MTWKYPVHHNNLLLTYSGDEHYTTTSQPIRLTHIIIPTIVKPRPASTHNLPTPETTDISDLSDLSGLSDNDRSGSSSNVSEIDEKDHINHGSDVDTETETETERGTEVDPDETFRADYNESDEDGESEDEGVRGQGGYSLDPNISQTSNITPLNGNGGGLINQFGNMTINNNQQTEQSVGTELTRINSASSSTYAESEGGYSEYSDNSSSIGEMGDSMTFPPIPKPPLKSGMKPVWADESVGVASGLEGVGEVRRDKRGHWEDKPTFFEYLYGA